MKYFLVIVPIGLGVFLFFLLRPTPLERVEDPPRPPEPPPTVISTPAPPSLATIMHPAFLQVFGRDNDPQAIVKAKDDVQDLPGKLAAAADAGNGQKMGAALRLCTLMQRAMTAAAATVEQDRRNESVGVMMKEGRDKTDKFFADARLRTWQQQMEPMRSQAGREFAVLGRPGVPSVAPVPASTPTATPPVEEPGNGSPPK